MFTTLSRAVWPTANSRNPNAFDRSSDFCFACTLRACQPATIIAIAAANPITTSKVVNVFRILMVLFPLTVVRSGLERIHSVFLGGGSFVGLVFFAIKGALYVSLYSKMGTEGSYYHSEFFLKDLVDCFFGGLKGRSTN